MRELGKYLVLMALMILMTGIMVIDVPGQVKLVDVSHDFTGEKTRIVIDLSQPIQYSVIKDWEDNTISVLLPNVSDTNPKRFKLNELRNYIINHAELTNTDKGLRLNITTTRDFNVKDFTLDTKSKLYLDVYLSAREPDVETLLQRGNAYELRGEYAKAVKQYEKALELKPDDEKILLHRSNAKHLLSQSNNGAYAIENTDGLSSSAEADADSKNLMPEGDTVQENNGNGDSNQDHVTPAAVITGGLPAEVSSSRSSNTKSGVMMGLQDLLRKSGTEFYILIGLYIIVGFLAFIIFMLIRKLIKLYKLSYKQKKNGGKLHISASRRRNLLRRNRPVLRSSNTNKEKFVNEKHIKDVQRFARKLSALYAKTESLNQQTPSKTERYSSQGERREEVPVVSVRGGSAYGGEEHTQKIETAFKENDRLPYDSESINLIKKFRENVVSQNSSKDKCEAVRQLAEQNWEIWEIARELSMSTEEVKIALGFNPDNGNSSIKGALYERIYRMADQRLSPPEIAGKLHLGEEEVRLALKLRKTHTA
ncbi:hypothetical protein AMJ80_08805 [bacterium SM23_31]|nr:MAG: hypothetical protein AMJ80_08805 [bacterium SM23_31]